jgi:molybdate transport system regulatory protein
MGLSVRNLLAGTVTAVTTGEVMATVKSRLAGGQEITAAITVEAVEDLGITEGARVRALVKSTEIALATGLVTGITVRNRLPGQVVSVAAGGAMATVKVAIEGGELTAAITREAADELGLDAGTRVVALVKSTEVALATE